MVKKKIFSILVGTALLMTTCALVTAQPPTNSNVNLPVTASIDIPAYVEFCGEKISLERYDMRERYDREQLSFLYMHSSSIQLIKRANRIFPIIEPILREQGIPDDFKYLAAIESMLDPRALSSAKAAGIWQFLETTGREFGLEVTAEIDERYHIEKSTVAACRYLHAAYRRFGCWATVAASYNGGMGRISTVQQQQLVQSSFDMLLVSETSRYVFRILAAKVFLENPQAFGFQLKREHLFHHIRTDEVRVSGAVPNWAEWAQERGITFAQLKDFNVWIRGNVLTNRAGKTYIVNIPKKEDLNFDVRKINVHNRRWVVD